jgi:hypothetical protein
MSTMAEGERSLAEGTNLSTEASVGRTDQPRERGRRESDQPKPRLPSPPQPSTFKNSHHGRPCHRRSP